MGCHTVCGIDPVTQSFGPNVNMLLQQLEMIINMFNMFVDIALFLELKFKPSIIGSDHDSKLEISLSTTGLAFVLLFRFSK
jgi:hypothetical protein